MREDRGKAVLLRQAAAETCSPREWPKKAGAPRCGVLPVVLHEKRTLARSLTVAARLLPASAPCSDDRYFLTFSPPGELVSGSGSASSSDSSSTSGSSGLQRQRWRRLGPPMLPWQAAARGAGSVRVCLR